VFLGLIHLGSSLVIAASITCPTLALSEHSEKSQISSELQKQLRHPRSRLRPSTAIMATELTVQSERAFQKQPHIFLNSKSKAKSRVGKGGRRWYKDVGLGFRTPKTAIEGHYIGMWISGDEAVLRPFSPWHSS